MNGDAAAPEVVTLVDLIERLAEPAEPAPIAITPQTPGWTVLAILLAVLAACFIWRGVRHWHANAYRRAALAELRAAGEDPAAIAAILRRTALAAWPRKQVASLVGCGWLEFLDATGDNRFSADLGRVLAEAPYNEGVDHAPGLSGTAARWIRHHRTKARP